MTINSRLMSCVCLCSGLVLFFSIPCFFSRRKLLTLSFSLSLCRAGFPFLQVPRLPRRLWLETNKSARKCETTQRREGRQVTEEEATLNDTTTDERIQETDVVCIYSPSAATAQLRMYRREEFPFISFRYLLLYSFIIKRDLLKRN